MRIELKQFRQRLRRFKLGAGPLRYSRNIETQIFCRRSLKFIGNRMLILRHFEACDHWDICHHFRRQYPVSFRPNFRVNAPLGLKYGALETIAHVHSISSSLWTTFSRNLKLEPSVCIELPLRLEEILSFLFYHSIFTQRFYNRKRYIRFVFETHLAPTQQKLATARAVRIFGFFLTRGTVSHCGTRISRKRKKMTVDGTRFDDGYKKKVDDYVGRRRRAWSLNRETLSVTS
jgi:hypothetical protein